LAPHFGLEAKFRFELLKTSCRCRALALKFTNEDLFPGLKFLR